MFGLLRPMSISEVRNYKEENVSNIEEVLYRFIATTRKTFEQTKEEYKQK